MACCAPGDEDIELDFVAWKEAADKCLPEYHGIVAEALSLLNAFPVKQLPQVLKQAKDHSTQARRVSKQKADEVNHCACMSWDSPFYVLAVGRGSPSGLRADAVAGLVSLLAGTKPTNKYLAQAALYALARIFAASKDEIISKRICKVWMEHENSDVRDDAFLSLYLIDNLDVIRYVETMRDLMQSTTKIDQAGAFWRRCPDKKLLPESRLKWDYVKNIFRDTVTKPDTMLFALLRLRILTVNELADFVDAQELCDVLLESVIRNPFITRLVLQASFLLLRCHPELVKKASQTTQEDLLDAAAEFCESSVFREVRHVARVFRKEFGDSALQVDELLGVPEKIDKKAIKASLVQQYAQLEDSTNGPLNVFRRQYNDDLLAYLRAGRKLKRGLWREAPGSKDYPGFVGLYYILLEVEDIPGEVISELLARRISMIRLMTLVHISVAKRTSFWSQVVTAVANDPNNEVRECGLKVLENLGVTRQQAANASRDSRLLELIGEMLRRERHNLV
eukprot:CAMPEP_0169114318 /NCGR_PEP_ID=MMETSP1015-20121227/28680_1 /TAXON_ID=342587 /ORGANISM="Karlodinium micrum, Strain CCMP2283" /LENGTH=507 /DNA_ID=CAMNT_0009176565 /DNA_START=57 /DNA_END=1576 /DNA_ORIENTATION=+